MNIIDEFGTKHKVVKITTHSSNSYEIRSTKPNEKGYMMLEIVAINDNQSNVNERVEHIHVDDFKENY